MRSKWVKGFSPYRHPPKTHGLCNIALRELPQFTALEASLGSASGAVY